MKYEASHVQCKPAVKEKLKEDWGGISSEMVFIGIKSRLNDYFRKFVMLFVVQLGWLYSELCICIVTWIFIRWNKSIHSHIYTKLQPHNNMCTDVCLRSTRRHVRKRQQWWRKQERPLPRIWARWKQVGEPHLDMENAKGWSQDVKRGLQPWRPWCSGRVAGWQVGQESRVDWWAVHETKFPPPFFLVLH